MIEVRNVSKRFENTLALDNISFLIPERTIFGLVGPDGAGKSTLLRILAGILKPTSGEIYFDGKDISIYSAELKEKISYMPQRFGLYEDLTVEENLHFFGRLFGVPLKERKLKIERLYRFSNLKPFKNRLAGKLSGGMKQKLGLMCALMHDPLILLLDEPTNGVDPVSRREFWEILYELLKSGTTIIISTAYLDEAERCTKIGLIYKGKFLYTGDPADISVSEKFVRFSLEKPMEAVELIKQKTSLDIFSRSGYFGFFTKDEDKDRKAIEVALEGKFEIKEWKVIKPGLEDIFVKWIKDIK